MLKNVKFFKSKAIKKINLAKVAEFMDYHKVKAKNTTFRYKDFGENYWLLLKGLCSAWVPVETPIIIDHMKLFLSAAQEFALQDAS